MPCHHFSSITIARGLEFVIPTGAYPDFLWSLVVPSNCMRLSVKKAAHIALGECHAQEIRGSHVAFRGFLPRKTTPRDLFETTVIAKPL
jgi:hypothetical protein